MRPPARDRKGLMCKSRRRAQPGHEALEARLVPAVQLTYGGLGLTLALQDLTNGGTPQVSISEPAQNQLRIDLGSSTFDGSSTVQATGLSYENAGSPTTSHSATVDISQSYTIASLQAALPGDALTLGPITDAVGGLANVTINAGSIVVAGLDTSNSEAGNVDLKAAGALTVAPNAMLNTGINTLSLSAGVNADGTESGSSGILTLARGSTTTSSNIFANAITLRGDQLVIDTSSNPALVGATPIDGGSPRAAITGLNYAQAMAFDAEGNLYVADGGAATVDVFAPGSTRPKAKLFGLSLPDAMAFDAKGNLYVADSGAAAVFVFAPGATRPTSKLTGVDWPDALAIDAHGNVFVANNDPDGVNNTVSMFTPGSTTATATLTGIDLPTALAFDASGNLYAADIGTTVGDPPVAVFPPGATFPTEDIYGPANAEALAFDSSGNLYVADGPDGTVSVYPPGATSTSTTITGLDDPDGMAFDKSGNLYVANKHSGTVSVFAPGTTNVIATISGLDAPSQLYFDASGNLYVLGQNSVSEFGSTQQAGGVVLRTGDPDLPINVGAVSNEGSGLTLTSAELAQVFTTATGTVTFGDSTQAGNITFDDASPATTPGASVAAVQSTTGGGAIILDGFNGTALVAGSGNVQLSSGTGGIVATGGASSLATTGQVSLDTTGGIGTRAGRILFDSVASPAAVTIGDTNAPTAGAYLGGQGALTLGDVLTANAPLDVTSASHLTVALNALLETGTGPLSLAAGINPDGTIASTGTLTILTGAVVTSEDTADDAITCARLTSTLQQAQMRPSSAPIARHPRQSPGLMVLPRWPSMQAATSTRPTTGPTLTVPLSAWLRRAASSPHRLSLGSAPPSRWPSTRAATFTWSIRTRAQ